MTEDYTPPKNPGPLILPEEVDLTDEDNEALKQISPAFKAKIGKIAYYLATVGMEFDEACLLAKTTEEYVNEKMEEFPQIATFFKVKELEYKKELMQTISRGAIITRNDKLAMWLLEKRFPEEFNLKKGVGGAGDTANSDYLMEAISFVRQSSKNGIVKKDAGQAFVVSREKGTDKKSLFKRVNDYLK